MAITVTPMANTTFYLLQKSGVQIEERTLWQLQKVAQKADFAAAQLRQLPIDASFHINPATLECTVLESAAIIIEQSCFMRIGGLDERLPEEIQLWDLSLRLQGAKAKMVYLPHLTVHYSKTTPTTSAQAFCKQAEANLCMAYKYGANIDILRAWMLFKDDNFTDKRNGQSKIKRIKSRLKLLPLFGALWSWRFTAGLAKGGARSAYRKGLPAYRGITVQPPLTRSPFISVLVRTCGRPQVLRQALQSLQNQSYHNFEVIVVEDGPNTAGEMIATEFEDLDIRYFWLGEYLGKGYTANYAMTKARGEFFNIIDEDNLLYPDHLELLAAVLQENPETDMVLTTAMIADLRVIPSGKYHMRPKDMYLLDYDRIDIFTMCQYNRLPLQTVLFKRNLYVRAGGMDEDATENEAWLMWLRYLSTARRTNPHGVDIERATCVYIIPKNQPSLNQSIHTYRDANETLLAKADIEFVLTPTELRSIYQSLLQDVAHLKKEGRLDDFLKRNLQ